MPAPLTPDEQRRLSTLRLYQILDTAGEKVFDDLTLLASQICQTPISLVSLVDEDRQWFKSRQGLEATETPRTMAFCAHTIQADDLLVIEDATKDERFANNPLVTDDPNIRFYAGAPLQVENGEKLGSLCVIDRVPRTLDEHQKRALGILRDAVTAQLELRRAAADLRRLEGLVPMCSWCRSVRSEETDGSTSWEPLEKYVQRVNLISHGICPDCQKRELTDPRSSSP